MLTNHQDNKQNGVHKCDGAQTVPGNEERVTVTLDLDM